MTIDFTAATLIQIVLALGLLNVWLLRPQLSTSFRGGNARSLKEEFQTYGLPDFMFYLVGTLKIIAAVLLLVGLWVPALTQPSAAVIVVLMIGALLMHVKVKDPLVKSVPAFFMLALSLAVVWFH
jgi:uncharacterized membrane protein YphA (DoxX/SURF4 family)